MRSLLLTSLITALLIGLSLTFVSAVAFVRTPVVTYEPGISEAEFHLYDNRTISEWNACLTSLEFNLTLYQWLRESVGYAYFWKGIARRSLGPCIGIFLGCVLVGWLERRHAGIGSPPERSTTL